VSPLLQLAWRSAWNRRVTVALTMLSVALSVALLLGVERLRNDARWAFTQTVSGTDLVVGARSGPVQLLLYAVFHIGGATQNVGWASYRALGEHPDVAWTVPLSLGDSHRGFRVVGTDAGFFDHVRYAGDRGLALAAGRPFGAIFEAVVGAEVAKQLGYSAGARILLSHGAGSGALAQHDDKPFEVVGVLERTGTPVDRSVLVSLESIEAVHVDWQAGVPIPGFRVPPEFVRKFDLAPKSVTAALVGLKSRAAVFRVQRFVNERPGEPLLAILPGVALQELWSLVGVAERALLAVSAMVVLVGLIGLAAAIAASLGERRRELAILRAVGASPAEIFALLAIESLLLTAVGGASGVALLYASAAAAGPWMQSTFGIAPALDAPSLREWTLLGWVMAAGLVASLLPGWRAYRMSLADGMMVRI
jgi:putative ABC transport system permease protein